MADCVSAKRRLGLVAIARARDGLYIAEAEARSREGAPHYPSRFLLDVDPTALEFPTSPPSTRSRARAACAHADRWMSDLVRDARFSAGDCVRHPTFGVGPVKAVDTAKRACEIEIGGMDAPCTISFKAKLDNAPATGSPSTELRPLPRSRAREKRLLMAVFGFSRSSLKVLTESAEYVSVRSGKT